MVICPDCGKEVPDAKFCKNCGASLAGVNEQTHVVDVEDSSDIETTVGDEVIEITPGEVKDAEVIEVNSRKVDDEEVFETKTSKSAKYCFNCGHELDGEFRFCPNCGYDLRNKTNVNRKSSRDVVTSSGEKNIIVAIILSVIIPGLGHFYLGLSRKGAIFLFAYVISAVLILLLVGLLLVMVVWIWALVDTIQSTNALNRGESVEDRLF